MRRTDDGFSRCMLLNSLIGLDGWLVQDSNKANIGELLIIIIIFFFFISRCSPKSRRTFGPLAATCSRLNSILISAPCMYHVLLFMAAETRHCASKTTTEQTKDTAFAH